MGNTKGKFIKGSVPHNKGIIKDRTGETRVMSNGLKATVIKYRHSKDIDIQFENGQKAYNLHYWAFTVGQIALPMLYEFIDDYVKCTNPNTKAYFIIDKDDISIVDGYLWNKCSDGYLSSYTGKIHRLIMNADVKEVVDHINGDVTDNRRCNLRICTSQQNSCNRDKSITNTSGYKGVSSEYGKWKASIQVNRKIFNLGRFATKEQAALAYNEAAIKYHGEFARLNIIAS